MCFSKFAIVAALCAAPNALDAQFTIDGRSIQVHGFASQGFAYSNDNNYLTMKTSQGSFAFTDGGLNVSSSITDKFRVGAQAYVRNVGELGKGHVDLDWAFGDYKFKDWFGVRAGKVKTALGLFNDTQDMEFLHTWAVLPQSLYPLDLRANNIAHTGADIYGEIPLKKAGSLSYTAYAGSRTNDTRGGYYYALADQGLPVTSFTGHSVGADLRWNPRIQGLMIGLSWANASETLKALEKSYGNAPLTVTNNPQYITSVYGDYVHGNWHFDGEYRQNYNILKVTVFGHSSPSSQGDQGWFLAGAYRVSKRLELGTYHSRFYVAHPTTPDPHADHIFDQTVTARFDLAKFWNVKVEGHFMDGYGDTYSAHGFYSRSNPGGLKPKTNLLVVRTGFNF